METRREFLRTAALATASPAVLARRPRAKPTVAVFGGGIAGLSAAHELAERGFAVTVFERDGWGGKARSTRIPGTAGRGRLPLPGEHSLRFFFGFYENLPDTMRRIPVPGGGTVFDRLRGIELLTLARAGRPDLNVPLAAPARPSLLPDQLLGTLAGLAGTSLPPEALARLASRLAVFMSSCDERRLGEFERQSWNDFTHADRFPGDYQAVIGELSQLLIASKGDDTSAKYMGWFLEHLVHCLVGRPAGLPAVMALDGPTSEAFIGPWVRHLRTLGVRFARGQELRGYELRRGRVAAARAGRRRVEADWYVSAVPVERARATWSRTVLRADPQLAGMLEVPTAWSTGVQYFLDRETDLGAGVAAAVDSPWALLYGTKAGLWRADIAGTYGRGDVHDCVSVAVANCDRPGPLTGKTVKQCTPREYRREVWEQLKAHVNTPDRALLHDDMLVTSRLGADLAWRDGRLRNRLPLAMPARATQQYRPQPRTGVPNLVLAGDYVDGDWEVTTMETAAYSGRRAAAVIAGDVPALPSFRPPEWEEAKRLDARRYRDGLPNLLDGGGG